MSVVLINQEIVHYEVLGRGRPVIFLHSWVGSWRYWIPTLQSASTDYRAYALDMWGFGDTSRGVDGFSVDKQVDLLDQFLYQMGMGKVVLGGGMASGHLWPCSLPPNSRSLLTAC